MRKVFNSNPELCHAWANQLQPEGRGSSMYFEGPVIYSYGPHYEIARFLTTEDGEQVCFVNSNGYSNTTAKHTSHVWSSIPDGIEVFKVPFIRSCGRQFIRVEDISAIVDKLKEQTNNLINKQLTARSNFYHFIDAKNKFDDINNIAALFNLLPVSVSDFPNWGEAEKKYQYIKDTEKQRDEEKKAKELIKQHDNLKKWLIGEFHGTLYNIPVHFRLTSDGTEIQTTKGARVSLEAAKRLYNKLKNGENCKGEKIDGFTLIDNNPETIKIGCHVINWPIADSFFAQVN